MISTVLQQLQNLDLHTDYFFCFNIQSGKGRFIGWHTPDLEKYLLDKGFFKIDYLYAEDESQHEYQNGCIQIVLSEQI
jgi:hypothetical protein